MSGRDDQVSAAEAELLDAVCRNVAALLSGASPHPRRIRVSAGTVAVVIEWPQVAVDVSALALVAAPVTAASVAGAEDGTGPVEGMERDGFCYVRASIVGTFYRAPEPGAKAFAAEGDLVKPGQQLGILEAMKMLFPVEAEQSGRITRFLVADAAPVESGAPLIALTIA